MPSTTKPIFSLLASLLLTLLITNLGHASPGLTTVTSSPDYTSGKQVTQIEDLRVKTQGGYLRITRIYEEGQWHWNKRWNPIELYGLKNPDAEQQLFASTDSSGSGGGGSTAVYLPPADLPYGIIRNEVGYIWSTVPTSYEHLTETERTYIQGNTRIEVNNQGESYTWYDRLGSTIHYAGTLIDTDPDPKVYAPVMPMASYSDNNGNTITLNRNAQGQIQSISGSGQTLLTYTYNAGQLSKITDYTGRTVEYHYTGDQLTAVRDVRGEVWQYQYDPDSGYLTSSSDPENHTINYTLDGKGLLLKQQSEDGIGLSYQTGYSKAQDHYTSYQTDSTGKVTEYWRNALGQIVRIDINGETRYTIDNILSDNSTDVRKINQDNFAVQGIRSRDNWGQIQIKCYATI
ncbi:MAG: hypothetical protein KAT04_00080 [Methylococcales bacterium]|nr:hypothetical protein [Methylococcales bacterium]